MRTPAIFLPWEFSHFVSVNSPQIHWETLEGSCVLSGSSVSSKGGKTMSAFESGIAFHLLAPASNTGCFYRLILSSD